jgi:ankyrin repeat domain-containing protein 50
MIGRIDASGLKLLHWVLFATRPLTLDELRFAVAIRDGMTDLNPKWDLPYPSFIEAALGLLTVEDERGIIRFTHLTIKEYLSNHSSQYFPGGHQLLAKTCLTYLSFAAMSSESGCTRYSEDGDLYPFLKYAAFGWGDHAREAADDPQTCDIALEWLLSENFSQLNKIRHKADARAWLSSHQAPLHEVCFFGLVSLTVKLLQLDHNVNELDLVRGCTPLHYAAHSGHLEIIQTLLECQHLHVNVQGMKGNTPLHRASLQGHIDAVKLLLQHPAIQVNLQNQEGRTALHLCAMNGHEGVVQLLLHHADIYINVPDKAGQTPLHLATKYSNNTQTINALLCHPNIDVNHCDSGGWTAFMLAVHRGSGEVVQRFLACDDIDIEVVNCQLRNIMMDQYDVTTLPQDLVCHLGLLSNGLYLAAKNGDKEVVFALLNEPNLQLNANYGEYKATALHEAVLNGHVDIVEALLQHPGIEVNSVDCYGDAALVWAARKGQSNVVKLLLQHPKIAVNQQTGLTWTALTEAVDEGHADVVRLLLAHKDIDIGKSRVAEPGFWDIKLPEYWISGQKYMTLPIDLLSSLGLWTSYELTGLEIELFSSSSY